MYIQQFVQTIASRRADATMGLAFATSGAMDVTVQITHVRTACPWLMIAQSNAQLATRIVFKQWRVRYFAHIFQSLCSHQFGQVYNSVDVPVTISSDMLVHQLSWTQGSTAPEHQTFADGKPFEKYDLSPSTTLDNCYYNFSLQKKVCRACSEESHGFCNYTTGRCQCDPQFSSFDCSYEACPHPTCSGESLTFSVF